ncbi:MAG: hypothetical protein HZB59_10040 [Ignavibacteriales bacterium]|nr:hypothetical protein [Ignavibacteriales bacterium]
MERDIELLLDNCIKELRNGKSIEECLAGYPDLVGQLKPLLMLVEKIQAVPQPEPAPEAISAALITIGQQLANRTIDQKASNTYRKKHKIISFLNIFQRPKLLWALNATFVLLIIVFGITTISANSLPGDILYPIKLVTEKVKFLLTFDSEKKAELRLTFSDKRLEEMIKTFQRSNALDTMLLKAMLDEAKLALEENKQPTQTASLFLTKLSHTNALQKDVLKRIRSQADPSSRPIVDKAIGMCDMRDRWMRGMMDDQNDNHSINSDSVYSTSPGSQRKEQSKKCEWGPGCDWMR